MDGLSGRLGAPHQVFVGIYWQRYGWVAPGMEISGLEDEYRLAAGKPHPSVCEAPGPWDQEPRLTAMIEGIRAAGAVSYRAFATPRELERLLADDLAVLLSETFEGDPGGYYLDRSGKLSDPAKKVEAEARKAEINFDLEMIVAKQRMGPADDAKVFCDVAASAVRSPAPDMRMSRRRYEELDASADGAPF